ncbi:hypothetical protein AAFF27_19715 [Xylophilus sp. GW821-FHT01B05]
MNEQWGGMVLGAVALVVTAVVVRFIRRRIERRRQAQWLARQPAPSRQVRRAQERARKQR